MTLGGLVLQGWNMPCHESVQTYYIIIPWFHYHACKKKGVEFKYVEFKMVENFATKWDHVHDSFVLFHVKIVHTNIFNIMLLVEFESTYKRLGWCWHIGSLLSMFWMVKMRRWKWYSNCCVIGDCNIIRVCEMLLYLMENMGSRDILDD